MRDDPLSYPNETEASFAGSFLVVLVAHVALLAVVWTMGKLVLKTPAHEPVLWLDGGGEIGSAAPLEQPAVAPPDISPQAAPEEPPPDPPEPPKNPSDLAIEPKPTPTPTPRPKPTPTPTPKPAIVKTTPKSSTSAATPKPPKKPAPGTGTAKIAPPRPGAKATPAKITSANARSTGSGPAASTAHAGTGTAANSGIKGGPGAPGGSGALLVGYFKKVEAQFHQEWQQPLTVVRSGREVEAHVRLRAGPDGTVESLTLVKPTGNLEVDQSIEQALRRVRKVERPPEELLKDGVLNELVAFILEL
jgi:TonB family protein